MGYEVVLVGGSNVGKTAIYNWFTRQHSIVADLPGVTRDYCKSVANFDCDFSVFVADTPGYMAEDSVSWECVSELILCDSDVVAIVLDASADELNLLEHKLFDWLIKNKKPYFIVFNKMDQVKDDVPNIDCSYLLRKNVPMAYTSVPHRRGMRSFVSCVRYFYDNSHKYRDLREEVNVSENIEREKFSKLVILGRPNSGKSTLLNSLLQKNIVVVSDVPGTTRDPVTVVKSLDSEVFVITDTAGIRRRTRIDNFIEKKSVSIALHQVNKSDVAILVMDALDPLTSQDLRLINIVFDAGLPFVVVINKMDLIKKVTDFKNHAQKVIQGHFNQMSVSILFVSAKTSKGITDIIKVSSYLFDMAGKVISTHELNKWLRGFSLNRVFRVKGKVFRFKYIVQSGSRPPSFVVFVNTDISNNVKTFFIRKLSERFDFMHVPCVVSFRKAKNPYAK